MTLSSSRLGRGLLEVAPGSGGRQVPESEEVGQGASAHHNGPEQPQWEATGLYHPPPWWITSIFSPLTVASAFQRHSKV